MPPDPVLATTLDLLRAQGVVLAHLASGASLGPRPGVNWFVVFAVRPQPRNGLDPLYYRGDGRGPFTARGQWLAQCDFATGGFWAMLELELTSRSAIHRVVLPFDDIQLHGPVLRDAIGVDFVVITDADDLEALPALDHPLTTARQP